MTTAIKQTGEPIKEAVSGDKIQECQRCRNTYILIWLEEGDNYKDFAFRHCPFCGLRTDEITGSVIV